MSSPWQYELENSKSRLQHLYETKTLSDCAFMVGVGDGVQVLAHKVVLASASPVLLEKLQAAESKKDKIVISDVEPETFESLLKYIYTDSVDIKTHKEAYKLKKAAIDYQLPFLEKKCVEYISADLTPQSVLQAYDMALCREDDNLIKKCEEVIKTKTKDVLSDESFQKASITVVGAIFSLDPLDIESEVDLLKAIDGYVKYRESHKAVLDSEQVSKQAIKDVVKKIRFLSLTARQFAEAKANTTVLEKEDACAILANLTSSKSGISMPEGFSTVKLPRKKQTNTYPVTEATFKCIIPNILQLKDKAFSTTVKIRDLFWHLQVNPTVEEGYLAMYVNADMEDDSVKWSCTGKVEMVIENGSHGKTRTLTEKYNDVNYGWGYTDMIAIADLKEPSNNYLQDGAMTVSINVKIEDLKIE